MSTKITLENKYDVGGGIGSWARSRENAKCGDVRVIGDVLMYVYSIYSRGPFKKPDVNWTPVDKKLNSWDELRKWAGSL